MKSVSLLLALVFAVQQLLAQTAGAFPASPVKNGGVTNAPLFLSISGNGKIFPFHDGQMLQVGR